MSQSWSKVLLEYLQNPQFTQTLDFLKKRSQETTIYPPLEKIFEAFSLTSFEEVKVVIVGQDPYHNQGQAHGLSFSVPEGITLPPSLKNIYREIENDVGVKKNMLQGDLTSWAEQGVLLLNSVLTVEKNLPGSHRGKGWEEFTTFVIQTISEKKEHCVFLLWGAYAQNKGNIIDTTKHLVLTSSHPSPFSAHKGFLGNKHFSQTNQYLTNHGKDSIQW